MTVWNGAWAAVAVLAVASSVVSAQTSPCEQFQSAETCYSYTASGTAPTACVWQVGATGLCTPDPCKALNTEADCLNSPNCLPTNWTGLIGCVTASLICDRLSVRDCTKFPQCAVRANSYCAMVPPPSPGTNSVLCEITFPVWSLALLFIWVCIMFILGFIVFLVVKKSRQAAIKGVERQEVVVDSVQIRDNFSLQQPLAA
jgi:hypothetical protein